MAEWWDAFISQIGNRDHAKQLKEASLAENLKVWTQLTTSAVVRTCTSMGWEAAARGHRSTRLPESASEYLALDGVAFPPSATSKVPWPLPLAVFELENSPRDARVGYSLWKVICVRAPLRIVFAYRRDWEQTRSLVEYLNSVVVGSWSSAERLALKGDTAVVTGCRGEGETFPYGYFKLWRLDANLGRLEKV